MCGIAGWVDFDRDLRPRVADVAAMTAALASRGPDEGQVWAETHCLLGHRRLVVVDPQGGRQPMERRWQGRRFVLIYNGELYNTAELRRELARAGWSFEGYGDTEALLVAYMHWGPDCLARLNGIFAFAVWQEPEEQLFLARDRLGVKPLFYAPRGRGLLFGSELKALLAHPQVPPEVDAEGLTEVLVMGPGRTPGHGVFRGVRELRPGRWLHFSRQGLRTGTYWQLDSREHGDDLATTAATVRELLEDAVRRQMVSDVPLGTMLSGGLDSSAVTAVAADALRAAGQGPLMTFSVDYVDNDRFFRPSDFQPNADAPWVRLVARQFATRHQTVLVEPRELADALRDALRARDLPGMADVDSSLYLFCRVIRDHATVVLSGECADELFGGYPWFHRPEDLAAQTFPWMRSLAHRLALYSPEVVAWLEPQAYVERRYREALAEVPRLPGEPPDQARLREIQYLTLTRFMPVLLERMDRMSMAVGLEVRVPFCDHRLLEYAWNVPWHLKTWGGQEKGILRRALEGVLPPQVLARRKSPYPKTHHPAYLEAVRARLLEVLADPGSPLRPLVRVDELRRFAAADAERMQLPWFGQLMSGPQLLAYLLQVEGWLRAYRVRIVG